MRESEREIDDNEISKDKRVLTIIYICMCVYAGSGVRVYHVCATKFVLCGTDLVCITGVA